MRVKSSNAVHQPQVSIAAFLAPIPDRSAQDALLLLLLAAASGQQDEGEDTDALKPTTMEYVSHGGEAGPATGNGNDGGNGGQPPPTVDGNSDFDDRQPRKGLPTGAKIAIGGVSALGVIAVLGASWIYMRVRDRVHNYSSMQQVAQQPVAHHPRNPIHQHVTKALSQNKSVTLSTAPAKASTESGNGLSTTPHDLKTTPATGNTPHKAGKASTSLPSLSAPALALSKTPKTDKPAPAAASSTRTNRHAHSVTTHASGHAHASAQGTTTAKRASPATPNTSGAPPAPPGLTTQPVVATTSAKTQHSATTPSSPAHVVTSIAAKSGNTTVATAGAHPAAATTKPADTSVATANATSDSDKSRRLAPKVASELHHIQHSLQHLQTQMVSLKQAKSAPHHAVAKAKKTHEHASAKAKTELAAVKKREAKLVAENKHLKGAVHWLSEVEARLKKKLHHKAAYPGWCVIGTGLNSAVLSGPEHKTKLVHVGTKIFGAKVTKIDPSHNVVMTTDGVFSCQN